MKSKRRKQQSEPPGPWMSKNENDVRRRLRVRVKVEPTQTQANNKADLSISPTKGSRSRSQRTVQRRRKKPKVENFNCTFCTPERPFNSKYELRSHVYRHHLNEEVSCKCHCGQQFLNLQDLKAHQQQVHPSESSKKFRCFLCDQEERLFPTRTKYKAHVRDVHDPEGRLVFCTMSNCSKTFKCLQNLTTHKETVHKDQGSTWSCPICQRSFKTKGTLGTHLSLIHGNPQREFECTKCWKLFKTKGTLNTHIKTMHTTTEPEHRCSKCEMRFKTKGNLGIHINLVHNEKHLEFDCPKCSRSFKTKGILVNHLVEVHRKRDDGIPKKCPAATSVVQSDTAGHSANAVPESHEQILPNSLQDDDESEKSTKVDLKLLTIPQIYQVENEESVYFRCEQCKYFFETLEGFHEHIKIFHMMDGNGTTSLQNAVN